MDLEELSAHYSSLAARVERLEGGRPREQPVPLSMPGEGQDDVVGYTGRGTVAAGPIEWRMARSWETTLDATEHDDLAAVFAALGNPVRLRVVAALAKADLTTAALAELLGQPSTGQLFHHLKELLAAGMVHQPHRGTYALHFAHVIPLLTIICAACDVSPALGAAEPH
jgi:DNA-binding transcriptional ArsR family regulator